MLIQSNIILLMSLSGGSVIILYGMLCLFTQRTLSTRLRYNLLKTGLAFFLFPFPELKYLFWDIWKELPGIASGINAAEGLAAEASQTVLQYERAALPLTLFSWIHMVVCGIIILVSLVRQTKKHFRIRHIYTKSSVSFDIHSYISDFEKIKEQIGIRRKIQFAFSGVCDAPLTVGFLSPVIVFPDEMKKKSPEDWDILLRHELNHIKANDLPIRFAARIAMAVHWFNPAVYLLYSEICCMSEIHCDSNAVSTYSPQMKEKYCRSIIDWSEYRGETQSPVPLRFTGSKTKKVIERRVLEMKHPKKQKRFVALLAALLTGLVGATSVFAYEAPDPIQVFQELYPESSYRVVKPTNHPVELNSSTGDTFVDKNGNVYEADSSERALCFHTYVDVVIEKHTVHSDGSCTTLYYDAKRCTRCAALKDVEYSYEGTFTKCPH